MARTRFLCAASVAAFVSASAVSALAQSTDPAWLDVLTEQLAADEQCEVEYFLNVKEDELGGRNTYEARAQCADGRQFDASRTGTQEDFVISACEVQVC